MTQTGRPLGGLPLLERPMGRRAFLRSCIVGAAALVGTASLAGCSGIEGFLEPPAVSQASYRVGIDCAHPAYEMLVDPSVDRSLPLENRDYNVSGFDAFFLSRVSEGLGCRPRMVDVDHADLADYLKRGYIDVAVSSVFNGSRDTGITFSDPYAAVDLAVVCRADSRFAGATSLEALEGARMAARSDTDLDRAISQVPGAVHVPPYGSRTYPASRWSPARSTPPWSTVGASSSAPGSSPSLWWLPSPLPSAPGPTRGPCASPCATTTPPSSTASTGSSPASPTRTPPRCGGMLKRSRPAPSSRSETYNCSVERHGAVIEQLHVRGRFAQWHPTRSSSAVLGSTT